MSKHIDALLKSKKVLLLQGPIGSFFAEFSDWLTSQNIQCFKVNFNAGDWRFYYGRANIWHFRKKPKHFQTWLKHQVCNHQIDALVCFGDCRYYHVQAKQLAQRLGIPFFVFEEGYVRPDYITFEANGVNHFSNFQYQLHQQSNSLNTIETHKTHNKFRLMVLSSIQYYIFWAVFFWLYPFYQHHRGYSPIQEMCYWIVSGYRRIKNYVLEPARLNTLIQQHDHNYFVFALQVHNDFQIRIHSEYRQIEDVIDEVMHSFSIHADSTHYLVFKHHPMDRGYRHYGRYIQSRARQLGIQQRVHYLCDVHLPTLLKHSIGLVTINSTTGIQALYHHIPVKVLGRAIYDVPQLTSQLNLDEFWSQRYIVNEQFYNSFCRSLIYATQLNGAYYGKHYWMNAVRVSE